MDELAKKLSAISFGVIGMICLIGVIQKRSWLEMFTIGGKFNSISISSEWFINVMLFGFQFLWL